MITTFSNYLRYNRGLSENTITAYEEGLHNFVNYTRSQGLDLRWSTVTKEIIDEYVRHMVMAEYKPATIKQHISSLRTFYKTCMAIGAIDHNPARYVSTPKLADSLPKTIELDAIRKALESNGTDEQAKAAIAIIFETGIRLQELLDMKREDINAQTKSIRIHGKGKKERTVYYGELTIKYGRKWRPEQHTQREVRHLVFMALKPVSNAPQLSPHAIRHTFATEMLNRGMRTEAIQKLLGHEHLETTEIYAKLGNSQTRQLYEQYAPRLN